MFFPHNGLRERHGLFFVFDTEGSKLLTQF